MREASGAFNDAEHVGVHVRDEPWQTEARQAELVDGERRRAEADAEAVERARVLAALAAHGRGEFPELEQDRQDSAGKTLQSESLGNVAARIYGDRSGELDEIAERIYRR